MKLTAKAIIKSTVAAWSCLLLVASAQAQQPTYHVKHDHVIGHCEGELVLTDKGIEYRTKNEKDARVWPYNEIKLLKILSSSKVVLVSYENRRLFFGADKTFAFELTDQKIDAETSKLLQSKIPRPLVTSIMQDGRQAAFQLPVQHSHRFGSCAGTLEVFDDGLAFVASNGKDSRAWRWTDLSGISRLGPYRLEILTYEPDLGGPERSYNFELKEPLPEEEFSLVWSKIYRLQPGRR